MAGWHASTRPQALVKHSKCKYNTKKYKQFTKIFRDSWGRLSPTGLIPNISRFHISSLLPSTLVIDLHYKYFMFLSFALYLYQLFYNIGVGWPQDRVKFQHFSQNTFLLVSRLITEEIVEIYS